jgi:uncharacterized protein YlbG (UPF0298 family)
MKLSDVKDKIDAKMDDPFFKAKLKRAFEKRLSEQEKKDWKVWKEENMLLLEEYYKERRLKEVGNIKYERWKQKYKEFLQLYNAEKNLEDTEYILCSAILRKEPVKSITYSDAHKCILGYRHCDIMFHFKDLVRKDPSSQGFFTSKGRFVNRTEAMQIALEAGQVKKGKTIHERGLFSEDLY